MTARIIFLGTAGSSSVVSRQLRYSGGIIFQIEDLQFHLDPGPGTLNSAKEFGVSLIRNTAILISHKHINHCNDLNVVIDAMTHGGIEHRGLILASKSVLENSEDNHSILTKYHKNLVEKIIPLGKQHKVGIELVEINTLSADHSDPSAVGFKFYCPKFILSYTGDTKYSETLVEELKGTDLLILNVPLPKGKEDGKNLNSDDAIKIISAVKPKAAIITHFGLEMLKADPIQEAREIQRITGIQTIAARDGLALSPGGYDQYPSPVKGYY